MTKEEKYNIAEWAIKYALKCGANEVVVSIRNQTYNSVDVREQKIEKLEQAIENGLNIRLYVNQKYSSHSTNRITKKVLENFIKKAVESTKFLDADKFRKLPDPALYYTGGGKDLKITDIAFSNINHENKIAHAYDVEKEVLSENNEKVISVSTGYYDEFLERVMLTSNGFKGDSSRTHFSVNASVSVKSGEARPQGGWYESDYFYDKLKIKNIGHIALQKALEKIGQRKIASATLPMIVENRTLGRLFSPLLGAIKARSIQQKNSFMLDKINAKVISDKITVIDNPSIIGGRGSKHFDGEGLALKKRMLFEKGVLKTYLIDTYYGNKLDMKPNSASTSNILFENGSKNLEELIAVQNRAIFVTGFNGGNSNDSTGDFSYGVEGFLIENGERVQPVSEMNITGNMLTLWSNIIEIGADPYKKSSWQTPTIVFDGVSFSGL